MPSNIEPLKFYQEPLYYSGILALIFIVLALAVNFSLNLRVILIIFALCFGAITFFMWDTRCPNCKRPFAKVEEKKEKMNERIETKIHYDKIKYLYSDGSVKKIENGKAHEINHKIIVYRHHYHCKKCNHDWSDDKEIDLDKHTFKPNIITTHTNEKNPLQALAENFGERVNKGNKTYNHYKSQTHSKHNKAKVESLSNSEKEEIIGQRGTKCEYSHCKETVTLEVHHIVARSNGGGNQPSNLIVLCPNHHTMADRGSIPATRLKQIVSKKLHISK